MKFSFFIIIMMSGFVNSSMAWERHQKIMQVLSETPATAKRTYLNQSIKVPSSASDLEEEKKIIQKLAIDLELNAEKIPLFTSATHTQKVLDLLRSELIDEPDFGMDQNLPNTADPTNDRAWMGGSVGPTSQGFRHMFFSGFSFSSPLASLQVPFRAVGQAPLRFQKLKAISDQFFKEGNLFWGVRTLMWALHIMQDLHQPFHVIQIPSLKMLPIKDLFKSFVARTTQTIANYHYAYEGLVLEYVNEASTSSFVDCFTLDTPAMPVASIFEVVNFTKEKGASLGADLYDAFPARLKMPEYNLPTGEVGEEGSLDYYAMIHALEEIKGMSETQKTTCTLMQHLSVLTWGELDRAFDFK